MHPSPLQKLRGPYVRLDGSNLAVVNPLIESYASVAGLLLNARQ